MNLSDYKVLESAVGYYIGRTYFDVKYQCEFPYDGLSGYYPTHAIATKALALFVGYGTLSN